MSPSHGVPHLTLMRARLSRDQRPQGADFVPFVRDVGPGVVGRWPRVLTGFPHAEPDSTGLHHTRMEALLSSRRGLQRDGGDVLCGLETSLCPHTVLFKDVAEPHAFASSSQVRGRGSPRRPSSTLAASTGVGADVPSQAKGYGTKGLWAPPRSMTPRDTHDRSRNSGVTRGRPVRRSAHPRRSRAQREMCA